MAIDRDTLLDEGIGDPGALANLAGQTVEISGFVLTDGPISATRINLHDGDDTLLVTGYTDTLDVESQTFTINGMSFDYSQMPSSDTADEAFQIGESVIVMGSVVDGIFQVSEQLTEGSIEEELESGDSVELSGLVTGYTAGQPFMVDGIPVQISDSTEFEFGSADILRDNLLVEVEGYFNESSVIVAEWVQIHRESDMELEGQIEAVDAQNKTFTLHGLIFTTTQDTQFEDFSAEDEHYFDITDLAVGDALFVDAFNDPDNAGTRIAALVVRGDEEDLEDDDEDWDDEAWDDDEEFEVEIVGQLTSINIDSLTLSNGIDVTLNELTEFSDYFYPGLLESALGSVVEVGGRFENGVLIAEYIEIEDLCDESLTMIETEEEETQGIGVVMEKACDVDYDEEWDDEEDDLRDEDEHDWDEDEREEDDDAEEDGEDDMDDEADEDEQDDDLEEDGDTQEDEDEEDE